MARARDAARKAYGEGEKAYAASDFATAYTAFSKATALIPTPAAAYWAAKSLDQSGKAEEAIQAYQALLADPNVSHLGDDKQGDAQTRLATLKAVNRRARSLAQMVNLSFSERGSMATLIGATTGFRARMPP